jgi:hypothetical protein
MENLIVLELRDLLFLVGEEEALGRCGMVPWL